MTFKDRLQAGETLHGLILTMNSPSISEMLCECGFDWFWVDMEHAPLSLREVQELAQVKKSQCAALVRIPANSEEWVKRVLDLGVEGIIVPHVNTVEQAKSAVQASYYPPQGNRSVGLTRASRYGMNPNYRQEANDQRLLFLQIEHKEGVGNIGEIVQVPGVDGIIIGPYDLSGSYGKPGQIHDPEVLSAIETVMRVCKQSNKPMGIFAKDVEDAKRYQELGFQLIATGIDVHYLWTAAKVTLDAVRGADVKLGGMRGILAHKES